jgi:hypothetical protein
MTAVLGEVARRGLSDLHSLQTAGGLSKKQVLEVLSGGGETDSPGGIGMLPDRARLACIFLLSDASRATPDEVAELSDALVAGAATLPPAPAHGSSRPGSGESASAAASAAASLGSLGATLGSFISGGADGEGSAASGSAGAGADGAAAVPAVSADVWRRQRGCAGPSDGLPGTDATRPWCRRRQAGEMRASHGQSTETPPVTARASASGCARTVAGVV